MNTKEKYVELEDRVSRFMMLEVPDQFPFIHMGTSYLVQDLWRTVKELMEEADRFKND